MEVDNPYPTLKKNKDVIHYVLEGGRLPQPDNCPDALYKLMRKMWAEEPVDRPSFSEVLDKLKEISGAVEQESKTEYSEIYALTEDDKDKGNKSIYYNM